MMTEREFEDALDRWGGDLERWPRQLAARARLRLEQVPGAADQLAAAAQVDAYLELLAPHQPPAHLAARIVARAAAPDALQRGLDWLAGRLWRPLMLALVLGVGGFLTGALVDEPLDADLADDAMTLAFTDLYGEIEDVQP